MQCKLFITPTASIAPPLPRYVLNVRYRDGRRIRHYYSTEQAAFTAFAVYCRLGMAIPYITVNPL